MKKTAQQVMNDTNAWLHRLANTKALQGPPEDREYVAPMDLARVIGKLLQKRAEGWPSGTGESGKGASAQGFEAPKVKAKKQAP